LQTKFKSFQEHMVNKDTCGKVKQLINLT